MAPKGMQTYSASQMSGVSQSIFSILLAPIIGNTERALALKSKRWEDSGPVQHQGNWSRSYQALTLIKGPQALRQSGFVTARIALGF